MTLLVGSELSPDVDTPAELGTNSLSISTAIYFAFYCLFLTALYFQCKLCGSPWKWFLASLSRAEMHSGESMRWSSQVYTAMQTSSQGYLPSIFKRCWKYLTAKMRFSPGHCLGPENWDLLKHQSTFFFEINLFFYRSIKHLQNLSRMVVPVLWYFNDLCFSLLNERLAAWLAWNWKRSNHCVSAPLIMHNVSVNRETTNPLNTIQKNLVRQAGSVMGLRWFYHCFPLKFNNVCSPFLKIYSPKKEVGEHGS